MKLMSATLKTMIFAVSLSMPLLIVAQTDPLSLKHGVYVEKHEKCKGAPNAAIMVWDGVGFSGAHSSRCTSRVLHRDKNRFQVSTSCSALGDGSPSGSGTDAADSALLTRLSSTAFVMLRDRQEPRSFHWCSANDVD